MKSYIVNACSGIKIELNKGQNISIIDTFGGQVVDFFAHITNDKMEFLSTGVTIDCNESLFLKVNDIVYTNKYREMFKIICDDVGCHDLLHPCCRKEMYDFFYKNGENHPNCLDNINNNIKTNYPIITPFNIFMNTKIFDNGKIEVCAPISKPGQKIVLKAMQNVIVGIASCSVSESKCNSGQCTPIEVIVE